MFNENLLMQKESIMKEGKMYGPSKPTARHTCIAVRDVGEASAVIMTHPDAHKDRIYTLAQPSCDFNQCAEALTSVLGRRVDYVQVPYDEAQRMFESKGMEGWQAKGINELYKEVDEGRFDFPSRDFKSITGREPMKFQDWVATVKDEFTSTA